MLNNFPTTSTSSMFPSSSPRFAIRSTNIILQDLDLPTEAIILIQNEKILDIILLDSDLPPETLETIYKDWDVQDYGNLYIFPGIVDSNVHLHTNFGSEWENITYSTELAAAGGVTTIIDNPIMSKPFTTGEDYIKSLQKRIKLIKANSKVDFGLYGLLEPRTETHIEQTLDLGVLGLKCYLMNCFQNTIGHYPPENFQNLLIDLEMRVPGILLVVHPEIATERELYSSSPCRTFIIEKRLDMNHAIKSLEFGGGAHKGSYIDDFAKKGESDEDDEENECPTATLDTPSKLKGRINKNREKSEIDDLVHFELVSYSFGQKGIENTDESNSDSDFTAGESTKENSKGVNSEQQQLSPSMLVQQRRKSNPPPKLKMLKKSLFAVSNVEEPIGNEESDFPTIYKTLGREPLAEIQEVGKEESKQCLTKEDLQEEEVTRGRDMAPGRCSISRHLESEIKEEKDEDSSGGKETQKIDLFKRRKQDIYYEASEEEDDDDETEDKITNTEATFGGRQRYQNIVEYEDSPKSRLHSFNSNKFGSISSYKDQRSTFDLSEKDHPEDLTEKEFQRSSRKFDSLNTYSEDQNHTSISPTRTKGFGTSKSIDEDMPAKQPQLVMNLSLVDQTSLVLESSPNHKSSQSQSHSSLNMSPMHSNRANTPAGSSLLARRISMSRKSSTGGGGGVLVSTSSTLSSPGSGFSKINPLNVNHISKNLNRNESVYNQSYRIFLANRPQSWEENAVSIILNSINPDCRVKIMLQNLSLATSLLKIREKKKENSIFLDKIISDCSPSHLFFTERMVKKGEAKYKVSPPFRNRENRQNLIENLRLGGIDTMGSYHFYVPPRFKAVDDGNFRRAFNGLDSMGCSLQAAWTASYSYQQKNNKRFTDEPIYQKTIVCNIIRQLYKSMCENTAKSLNIEKRKGSIAKGKDADFVIWDPFKVDGSQLNPNHVFSGKALLGTVYKTYLRGHLIYNKEDNELISKDYKPEFIIRNWN